MQFAALHSRFDRHHVQQSKLIDELGERVQTLDDPTTSEAPFECARLATWAVVPAPAWMRSVGGAAFARSRTAKADLTAFADLPLLVDLAIDVPLPADA